MNWANKERVSSSPVRLSGGHVSCVCVPRCFALAKRLETRASGRWLAQQIICITARARRAARSRQLGHLNSPFCCPVDLRAMTSALVADFGRAAARKPDLVSQIARPGDGRAKSSRPANYKGREQLSYLWRGHSAEIRRWQRSNARNWRNKLAHSARVLSKPLVKCANWPDETLPFIAAEGRNNKGDKLGLALELGARTPEKALSHCRRRAAAAPSQRD